MTEDQEVVWGRWSYGDIIKDDVILKVGRFCSIARGVRAIGLLNHKREWITSYPFMQMWKMEDAPNSISEENNKVIVKNDVWIGAYSTLFGGTVLNDGVIVGAGSVVKKEVPPYSVILGNPARVVRKRFSDEQIEKLLQIKWWNWEDEKIKKYMPLLCSPDIERFLEAVDADK